MTASRGRGWWSAAKAAIKALVWGIIGPPLLYSMVLFVSIVLYNVARKPLAEILPVANATFIWSLYFGIVMAGPLGALGALAVTWQAFRWTARGDNPRRVMRKALVLGGLFGLLVPIWIALWLALFQATTFSGRFDSPGTFLYMATNSVPVALFSTWILVRFIRPNLRSWSAQLHA
jgi:hypothetical protein